MFPHVSQLNYANVLNYTNRWQIQKLVVVEYYQSIYVVDFAATAADVVDVVAAAGVVVAVVAEVVVAIDRYYLRSDDNFHQLLINREQ